MHTTVKTAPRVTSSLRELNHEPASSVAEATLDGPDELALANAGSGLIMSSASKLRKPLSPTAPHPARCGVNAAPSLLPCPPRRTGPCPSQTLGLIDPRLRCQARPAPHLTKPSACSALGAGLQTVQGSCLRAGQRQRPSLGQSDPRAQARSPQKPVRPDRWSAH